MEGAVADRDIRVDFVVLYLEAQFVHLDRDPSVVLAQVLRIGRLVQEPGKNTFVSFIPHITILQKDN